MRECEDRDAIGQSLLDTVLDPVLDTAGTSEKALLAVTVCDPACGAGDFLVAAARRIAARVARAREDNPEPPAGTLRAALRDVTETCVYGVDLSATAVERTRARLRRECGASAALDDHIRQGNSLIGATPGLVDGGIPDAAFKPAGGDDPKFARSLRRANCKPAPGQVTLFSDQAEHTLAQERLVADAWCAAFLWAKRPDAPHPIVNRGLADLRERGPAGILPDTLAEIERLREEHRFFHWHLEFPEVFARGGFSCMLTEPPASLAGQPFTERVATLIAPEGRAGCVVPAGPGDAGSRLASLVHRGARSWLYAFEDGQTFTLTAEEAALLNPNTGSPPPFRGRRAAALVTAVHRRVPVLWDETRDGGNPWKIRLAPGFFRLRNDSGRFRTSESLLEEGWEPDGTVFTRDSERMLGVYEAAMVHHFDHQHGPPRYWAGEHAPVAERLAELGWTRDWLCGWRAGTRPDDERTAVAAFLPRAAVTESFPLMLPRAVPPFVAALIAAQSSLIFDFVCREKLGGGKPRPAAWKQLPVPAPHTFEPHLPFLVPRVLELVYTAGEMAPLARDLDDDGDPFAWDDDRRAELRAELDAFFFRLYGIEERDDAEYILDSFPAENGQLILGAYDRMAAAEAAGSAYETRIIPSPGHGRRAARPLGRRVPAQPSVPY